MSAWVPPSHWQAFALHCSRAYKLYPQCNAQPHKSTCILSAHKCNAQVHKWTAPWGTCATLGQKCMWVSPWRHLMRGAGLACLVLEGFIFRRAHDPDLFAVSAGCVKGVDVWVQAQQVLS
eukprot:scaffold64953_cov18-Tisochrysis_lutea.AAC.1